MTSPTPTHRRFSPTPDWLIFGLLVVEGLLWLSERYRWFWFNEKKGWTVLIGVAVVGVAMLVMLLWFIVALVFRWRFQFSIRSLLVLTVAVALPCSWLGVELSKATRRRTNVEAIANIRGHVVYNWDPATTPQPAIPTWLCHLLGDDFFAEIVEADFQHGKSTDFGFKQLIGCNLLRAVFASNSDCTDAGLQHLTSLPQLYLLFLDGTQVTDQGVVDFQRALPNCKVYLKPVNVWNYKGRYFVDLPVTSTEVTDKGLKNRQQPLPNCKIEH